MFSDDTSPTFNYSIENPPQTPGEDLAEVNFDGNFVDAVVDGQSNNSPGFFFDDDADIIEFGVVNYDDPNAPGEDRAILVIVLIDVSENKEYIYQLDSIPGSSIPDFDTIAADNPGNPEQAKIDAFNNFDNNQITTVLSPADPNVDIPQNTDLPAGDFTDGVVGDSDVFFGSEFADFVDLGAGNDDAQGNGGDDALIGGAGDDTLDGGDGNDALIGGGDNDLLITGSNDGDDYVDAGAGIDVIDMTGTAGNEFAFVSIGHFDLSPSTGITVDLTFDDQDSDVISKGSDGVTTLLGVNELLSQDGIYIGGTDNVDTFNMTGRDGGYMHVQGFDGVDIYNFGYSTSTVRLDLRGGDQAILLDASRITEQVINDGYGNTETYILGENPENSQQTARVNQFQLGAFSDVVIGSDNSERFLMLGGDDTVKAGGGNDTLRFDRTGVEGITLDLNIKGNRADNLATTEIDESIAYDGTAVGFYNDGNGPVGFTVYFDDIEEFRGSREDDEMIADNSGVRFEGRGGNDTLVGGTGNDTLIGGSGSNELFGGDGDDQIVIGGGDGSQFIRSGAGNDVIDFTTGSFMDAFISFSDLSSGITLYINEAGQSDRADKDVQGTTDFININDVVGSDGLGIEGTNQADTFFVTNTDEDGFVSVRGGDGLDVYNFGDSAGTLRFDLRGGDGAIVNLSLGSNQVIDDGYGNTENIGDITRITELRTTDGDDSVIGSTGDDRFILRIGSDTLEAGDGFDTLRYDRSNIDSIYVDLEDARAYDGKVSGGYASGFWSDGNGNGTFETFISDVEAIRGSREGNDVLLGDSENNRFEGRGGNDSLNGRDGDDTLAGQGGDDELTGGVGVDIFQYDGQGFDIITDFEVGIDELQAFDETKSNEEINDIIANVFEDSFGNAQLDFGDGNGLLLQGVNAFSVQDGSVFNGGGGGGGNPGDDIFGTEGDDNFDNSIQGTSESERLFGLGGEDWFIGSLGDDTIDGGTSNQDVIFYDFNASFNGIFINNTGSVIDGVAAFTVDKGVGTDTLISVENFHGSDGNDTIYAGNSASYVFDRAGNDEIFAGETPDTGNGLIFAAGSGNDTMWGSNFDNDIVDYGDDSFDAAGAISQGVTVDLVNGTATDGWGGLDELNSIEWVSGSRLNDSIRGDGGDNRLSGNDGNDTIESGLGDDNISGGAGDDSIIAGGSSGFDFIETGAGIDVVDFTTALGAYGAGVSFGDLDYGDEGPEEENLVGVTFNVDTANANGSVDKGALGTTTLINVAEVIESDEGGLDLFGSTENDTFNITNNLNNSFLALRGGDGSDFYNIGASTGGIRLDFRGGETGVVLNLGLSENQVLNDGFGNVEDIDGIENIREFRTGDGDDLITGSALDERFITRLGSDTLDGGDGIDTLRYDRSFVESVVVDLQNAQGGSAGYAIGQWTNDGQPDTFETFIDNVENVRGSREGGDDIAGNRDANVIEGLGGNDTLDGSVGNDTIYGGEGADSIFGGVGFDTLYGDNGNDTLDGGTGADLIEGGEGADRILGGDGFDILNGGGGNDTILGGDSPDRLDGGDGNDFLRAGTNFGGSVDGIAGGLGNDTLLGEGGFDLLLGDEGDDSLDGGNQADNLFGGIGNDTMLGGQGFDRLFGGGDDDLMFGGTDTDSLFGDGGNDTQYGGDQNDRVWGGGGNDELYGDADDDELVGGAGFDTLNGGTGDDVLTGAFNADTFVFEDGHGNDTITDFDALSGAEKIDLSAITTALITDIADLKANHLGASAPTDVLIETGTGSSILLQGVDVDDLSASDFIFTV